MIRRAALIASDHRRICKMRSDGHRAHDSQKTFSLKPQRSAAASSIPPSLPPSSFKVPLKWMPQSNPWMCFHIKSASLMDLLPEGSSQWMPVTLTTATTTAKKKNNGVFFFLNKNARLCFSAVRKCNVSRGLNHQRAQKANRGRMTGTLAGASRPSFPQSGQGKNPQERKRRRQRETRHRETIREASLN